MASRKAKKAAVMAKNSVKRMAKRLRTEGLIKGAMGGGAAKLYPETYAPEGAAAVSEGAASGSGLLRKIGGKAGLVGIGLFLADLIKNQGLDAYGIGQQADLQGQQMEAQGQAATPENFLIQALLPSSEQQKQQAMQALMQQLTGGNAPRQLARGEVLT